MIIDTTYILPLARIGVRTDLLRAIAENRVKSLDFSDLRLSLISLFELQAKASRLGIPPEDVVKAINVVLKSFRVIPFYEAKIVKIAHELRQSVLSDYIDCIIVATAVALGDSLATEDRDILSRRDELRKMFGVDIVSYRDLVESRV